ncbi:hypothetical protein AS594_36045 [Streptomyces agglomeratus]|uniref:Uncharacterized protein n=1 Tax=Streptomyces agglomeratus TaxID=285458 RepID=A0A1E5PI16_9ACTN|nr:hypothetical protein AS594_36045 [Streptomyces agglomeratus]
MQGLVHEDGAGDLQQIKGDQVGGLLPGGPLGPGTAEPGPVLKCCEVQPAVVPDHQLGVDDGLDAERGRGPGDLREGRAKIGAALGLEVRLGAGEHEDADPSAVCSNSTGLAPDDGRAVTERASIGSTGGERCTLHSYAFRAPPARRAARGSPAAQHSGRRCSAAPARG